MFWFKGENREGNAGKFSEWIYVSWDGGGVMKKREFCQEKASLWQHISFKQPLTCSLQAWGN